MAIRHWLVGTVTFSTSFIALWYGIVEFLAYGIGGTIGAIGIFLWFVVPIALTSYAVNATPAPKLPESHRTPDAACPSCGQPFNFDTGEGYRKYGDREGKIQCSNRDCNRTTYVK